MKDIPIVDVFNYLGDMALKQIFDAGICPYKNKFILLCNNDFGPFIAKVLAAYVKDWRLLIRMKTKTRYDYWIRSTGLVDFRKSIFRQVTKMPKPLFLLPILLIRTGSEKKRRSVFFKSNRRLSDPFILRYAGDVDEDVL